MKAESLIFRKLTPNEFKAITNTINSEGGGSQTYIDFPKGSISDDEFKEFFGNNGTPNTNGFEWVFYVNSLSIGRNQQREIISARRDSSNSLREQNNENRVEIWKNEKSGFPNDGYDEKNNPIIVFILKSDDGEFWAGWFYRNECTDNWPMNKGLSTMFWEDCAYIKFDCPIQFDTSDYKWPFLKGDKSHITLSNKKVIQQIYYGAPGTGKSHEVKKQTGEWLNEDEDQDLPNVFRTTFHPDTDYASFVGCYKPTMRKTGKKHQVDGKDVDDEEIIYEYVPQVFADAYVYAYNNPGTPTYLVIEEINRGNCAQIFGDLFQLLDRKNGKSEYKIKADKDLAKYLCEAKDKDGQDVLKDKDGIKDGKLCLPANLHILATMNTSDQSLFPMDSAFKRRWDWEYIPIKYSNSNWRIDIAGYKYSWIDFQTEINKRIFGATESEDKQLGDFFVKADDNNIISSKLLLNKVIFYLWNDVCKDGDGDIFKVNTDLDYSKELDPAKNEDITFSKFFKETDLKLKQWMRYLNIKPLNSQEDDDEEKEDESHQQEEGVKPNEAKPDTYSKPEYKSIVENMLPQLSNEDISIFRNGFDWSFSEMPGSYARMSLALDAPAKNKKATVKLWIPAPTGYSKSAECFAYLKDRGGEDIIRTTASKYGYEYEELGIHSKNPNPVVGWKITIPMTFAPENSQAESQKLLDILLEVRTAFDPIISDFLKK